MLTDPFSGQATMDDVARESGVAVSTVSRALRDDRRIGAVTRERIKSVALRLGYRPNPMVAALMSHVRAAHPPAASCNLAWLDFADDPERWRRLPVQRAFYTGANARAIRASYVLERMPTRTPGMTPARLAQILMSRGVRGVLLPYFEGSGGLSTSIPLPLGQFTTVIVGTQFQQPALHFATNDQYASSRLAVLELWKLGYRRIGYVGEPFAETVVNNRFCAGYLATVQLELGVAPLPPLLSTKPDQIRAWLRARKPDVVVTTDPDLLKTVRGLGWRVPDQLGVAHLHVDADDPVISGICQNSEAVGAAAVDLLIGQLSSNEHGVPAHAKGVLVPGFWKPGQTVRGAGAEPVDPCATVSANGR
jgi:DNA-binding LacI/PurR family transcriptional regulator